MTALKSHPARGPPSRQCWLAPRLDLAAVCAPGPQRVEVTGPGERLLGQIRVDVGAPREQRRAFALECLDWTEHRAHLAKRPRRRAL